MRLALILPFSYFNPTSIHIYVYAGDMRCVVRDVAPEINIRLYNHAIQEVRSGVTFSILQFRCTKCSSHTICDESS